MKTFLKMNHAGSFASLGVATCCVLPIALMLAGLGGGWLAVFGKIAAASYFVLTASSLLLLTAWGTALYRGALGQLQWHLLVSTLVTALAWAIVLNETAINDHLISLM
ncbi:MULTISPECIES: hypothetical protein [unclassified Pseudovibrio]|uniref:hypothetical protein n=1 Tax=unclassified Pseudovibrio TaxID=2627060 RepID=UPI0007AE61D7|nr:MULTISPECIES: hypothetical protein [unclassified Pseudovibrio]KZK98769.1 hypothetical protein PsW74_03358 [Pseudovibrio sp. W74]KZL09262.1 hypothetical protein PsAD14_02323 [Pseudovibrio sp. Ad14]